MNEPLPAHGKTVMILESQIQHWYPEKYTVTSAILWGHKKMHACLQWGLKLCAEGGKDNTIGIDAILSI